MNELGAVVLSGGGAARLGGADKASLEIGGRTMLERVLDALVDVPEIVIVGPDAITNRPVTFRREDPVGGGPAAALLAGLDGFVRRPARVVALAVDLPLLTPATIARLVEASAGHDGALLVDGEGRRQYLCAAYDGAMLAAAGAGDVHGMSMRELVRGLDLVEVAAVGQEAQDVDSWSDVRMLREQLGDDRP